MNVLEIPLNQIKADSDFNCRGQITPFDVLDLCRDIEQVAENNPQHPSGLIQPITVTPLKEAIGEYKYTLVAGFRRFMAFNVMKRKTIPAVVMEGLDETQQYLINIKENLVRKDLNILQEAKALERFRLKGWSEEKIMEELNAKRGWVQVRMMLLKLPIEIQQKAAEGYITQNHIRDLYSIKDNQKRMEAVKTIIAAKQRNESKAVSIKTKINKISKRRRDSSEINKMQDHIREEIGNNIATMTLGWCNGYLNDLEYHQELKRFAETLGLNYTIPRFDE